jgi:hypothetical protein
VNNGSRISYPAIFVALIAAAVVSSFWYSPLVFGKPWIALRNASSCGVIDNTMHAWKMAANLVREFILIYVMARLIAALGIADSKGALRLGFWMWLGFPVQMLVGASLWDSKPWALDMIHAGDWLLKMMFIALILANWRRVQIARLQTSTQ